MTRLSVLLQALESVGVGLDVEVVRDALWLAEQLKSRDRLAAAEGAPAVPLDFRTSDGAATGRGAREQGGPRNERDRPDGVAARESSPPPAFQPGASSPSGGGPAAAAFSRVRLPRAAGLVGGRGIPGALRPLRRKVRSPRAAIDEAATVRRAIEDDLWLPIYRSLAERWLELALVVDSSISMSVWQEQVRELRRVFVRSGAFRDVRLWSMTTDGQAIAVGPMTARTRRPPSQRLQSPFGGGRRGLVIVMSDCVDAAWYDGRVLGLLNEWSNDSPVAILQVLPERLWPRTALAEGARVKLRAVTAAMTNPHLCWEAELPLPEAGWRSRSIGVNRRLAMFPVVTADSISLRRLARMVAGASDEPVDGVLFDTEADIPVPAAPKEGADERVRRFWSVSSSAATELASLLSAAPVPSTGVLTLLRKELMPAADASAEAEVLFSGLLSVPQTARIGDDLPLVFQEGVRPVLLENAPVDRVLESLRHVAAHARVPGISEKTFESWILDPKSSAETLDPAGDAVAAQVAGVLAQIGGAYARIVHPDARRTASTREQTAPPDADVPEPARALRVFRIFVGASAGAREETVAMREIVDRINAGAAETLGSRFELEQWTDLAFPLGETSEPLGARLASADVYVGIVSRGVERGVEQEFEAAAAHFKQTGKPRIRFYLNRVPSPDAGPDAPNAIASQVQFQQWLKRTGSSYRVYDGAAEFRERVEHDLSRLLADLNAEASAPAQAAATRTCLFIGGFGEKPDYPTGRVLDLDRSYRMVKAAVEEAGLRCVRADEVVHSGVIDKPLYELLLTADVVIADLSTSNANAIYELGVRLALRPATTIVIAEKQFQFPFELGHLEIRRYEHLGKGIDAEEHERMRRELSEAIRSAIDRSEVDSPVYTFLPTLQPPATGTAASAAASAGPRSEGAPKARCFVVMGYAKKTDFATNRTLNLDASYDVIKGAAEEAGLECVRADEIGHSGVIDRPIYEHLLRADIVIADLSTSNANALLELGIRHGLRPAITIVVAEDEFRFPFDMNRLVIHRYHHLGEDIGLKEALRFRKNLVDVIQTLTARHEVDSPVYLHLPNLTPPTLGDAPEQPGAQEDAVVDELREAMREGKWPLAIALARRLVDRRSTDRFARQQLALATLRSKQPNASSAIAAAKAILEPLEPRASADVETLGIWGSIHKREWELTADRAALDEAITAYEHAFQLGIDHYVGSNLSFLLLTRASVATATSSDDRFRAERAARLVIGACEAQLRSGPDGRRNPTEQFWIRSALAEALLVVGESERSSDVMKQLDSEAPEPWMRASVHEQMNKMRLLIGPTAP